MSEHWHSGFTQVYWTCKALRDGRTINHMDEIGEVRGWRLGAIIHNLKHHYDWPIETEYRGHGRIAHYSHSKSSDQQKLRWPPSARRLAPDFRDAGDE